MAAEGSAPQSGPRGPTRRLFFALWPDEAMREAMVEATREPVRASGGRPIPSRNLHLTLAFLGSVPQRRLSELADAACAATENPGPDAAVARPPAQPLELIFDRVEHWRAAQLLCASAAEVPPRVAALARRLQEALIGRGFAPDLKPFRPHVTVARKVMRPSITGKMHPVVWRCSELALVESRTLPEGALYSVVESYALCSAQKAANNNETA